jgi:hypothetical protein
MFHILEKFIVAKGCKLSLYAHKFIGISNCNRVRTTEADSSLDWTKAKCSISRLFKVEGENVILRISPSNFSACEEKNRHDDENEVFNQYAHPDP